MDSMTLVSVKIFFFCFTWRTWRHVTTTVWNKWRAIDKFATVMQWHKKLSEKCIIMKNFCVTLPCLDKFCGLNRWSLEVEQKRCLLPERRGLSSVAQPSQWQLHLTLSLQGIPNCPSNFPVSQSRHTKARNQCWCPTPHLCSVFNNVHVEANTAWPLDIDTLHIWLRAAIAWLHPNL